MTASNETGRNVEFSRIPDENVPSSLLNGGLRWYKFWVHTADNEFASMDGSIQYAHDERRPRTVLQLTGVIAMVDEPPELVIEEEPVTERDVVQYTVLRGRIFSEEAELSALTGLARAIFKLHDYM